MIIRREIKRTLVQIQSHIEEYAEVMSKRCPLLLWKLVIKSHTFAGQEASFVEKEKAKTKLQQIRQASLSLSEHHTRFEVENMCSAATIAPRIP